MEDNGKLDGFHEPGEGECQIRTVVLEQHRELEPEEIEHLEEQFAKCGVEIILLPVGVFFEGEL